MVAAALQPDALAVIPAAERIVGVPLGALVFLAGQPESAAALDLADDALKSGGVGV